MCLDGRQFNSPRLGYGLFICSLSDVSHEDPPTPVKSLNLPRGRRPGVIASVPIGLLPSFWLADVTTDRQAPLGAWLRIVHCRISCVFPVPEAINLAIGRFREPTLEQEL